MGMTGNTELLGNILITIELEVFEPVPCTDLSEGRLMFGAGTAANKVFN